MAVCMLGSLSISYPMEWGIFSIPTKISTLDNSSRAKSMARGTIFLAKEPFSQVCGSKTKKYKENWPCLTAIFSTDVSRTINVTKVLTVTGTVMSTKVHGKTMSSKASVSCTCRTGKNTKANSSKAKNTVRGFTHGKTETDFRDNSPMTKGKGLDSITGTMEVCTRESGRLIGWMGLEGWPRMAWMWLESSLQIILKDPSRRRSLGRWEILS